MLTRAEALVQKLDPSFQHVSDGHPAVFETQSIEFHFIELCGGAGKVSKLLAEGGWVTGPNIGLDSSPFFHLRRLKLLSWLYYLLGPGQRHDRASLRNIQPSPAPSFQRL